MKIFHADHNISESTLTWALAQFTAQGLQGHVVSVLPRGQGERAEGGGALWTSGP